MEITINSKQMIAFIWTIIAIAISLAVVLSPIGYYYGYYGFGPWQYSLLLFFGSLLIMTLPVYLLIALWAIVAKNSES